MVELFKTGAYYVNGQLIPDDGSAEAKLAQMGISTTKEEAVKNTIMENPEFEIVDVSHQGDWVSITAVRK